MKTFSNTSQLDKLVWSTVPVCLGTVCRRCRSNHAQSRKWAAVLPFYPLCYMVGVEVGKLEIRPFLSSPKYKVKQTLLSMDVLYTGTETHWTALDISKSSLADDTSGFFIFVCVLAVWKPAWCINIIYRCISVYTNTSRLGHRTDN